MFSTLAYSNAVSILEAGSF